MNKAIIDEIEAQITKERKAVDYDIKEFTVELILNKYEQGREDDENEIYIPSYQRAYVWDVKRASKFIESVLLGLPIPYLFVAETDEGRFEVIDGSQRIRTLANFKNNKLVLKGLEKLDLLNDLSYQDLSISRQRKFNNTTLRTITLTDKSDEDIRFLMFERINTGSVNLEQMQKRKGLYAGNFTNFLYKQQEHLVYKKLTHFTELEQARDEPVELLLRFFAYSEQYNSFSGTVNEFLTNFLIEKNEQGFDSTLYQHNLDKMLNFIQCYMPQAFTIASGNKKTPRIRFEAISVGVQLALQQQPNLVPEPHVLQWLNSEEFATLVSGGSQNSRKKLIRRVEYVRDKLLGG